MEQITSAQNPKVKMLLELQAKSKARRESGLFVVEGVREIQHCLGCGYELHSLFVCPDICGEAGTSFLQTCPPPGTGRGRGPQDTSSAQQDAGDCGRGRSEAELCRNDGAREARMSVFQLSRQVYDKVAYRGGTEGMIAEFKAKTITLDQLKFRNEHPLIVVLESVEKPGNLGAVLRSADAAGADAVVICDPLTDLFNPNLIRASIGAIFTVPTVACSSQEAIEWFQKGGFKILTAQLQDSSLYYETDMTGPTAIVMGTESTGLSDQWRKAASAHIRIPMLGRLDSLNVSVSAAILLFEAVRQRQ